MQWTFIHSFGKNMFEAARQLACFFPYGDGILTSPTGGNGILTSPILLVQSTRLSSLAFCYSLVHDEIKSGLSMVLGFIPLGSDRSPS
uniref:Uncharacterized protein n=1 Tax=Arundo donax TaxID=35708 RepID=A0A0A9FVC2_ARUDO